MTRTPWQRNTSSKGPSRQRRIGGSTRLLVNFVPASPSFPGGLGGVLPSRSWSAMERFSASSWASTSSSLLNP